MWFVITIGILVWILYTVLNRKKDSEEVLIDASLYGIVAILIATIISLILGNFIPETAIGEISRTETPLIALKDNMAVEGHQYAYRAYINEELQYTYLYEIEGKGLTSGRCDADATYINYIQPNESPRIIKIEKSITHPLWNYLIVGKSIYNFETEYYLYVPEGSVIAEGQYEIDLK